MKKIWFKRKLYGWGWTPASWEGWLSTLVLLAIIIINFYRIDSASHSISDTLLKFIPQTWIPAIILIFLCIYKGEKPRWQWGKRIEDEEENGSIK